MAEQPEPDDNIAAEFRNLGRNLVNAIQTAWDAPERRRIQEDLLNGFNEVGTALKREAEQVSRSEKGQQLKRDFEELGEKLRSSEIQDGLRRDLIGVLKAANSEIEKVISRFSAQDSQSDSENSTPPDAMDAD